MEAASSSERQRSSAISSQPLEFDPDDGNKHPVYSRCEHAGAAQRTGMHSQLKVDIKRRSIVGWVASPLLLSLQQQHIRAQSYFSMHL
jgi:hypothetical protein